MFPGMEPGSLKGGHWGKMKSSTPHICFIWFQMKSSPLIFWGALPGPRMLKFSSRSQEVGQDGGINSSSCLWFLWSVKVCDREDWDTPGRVKGMRWLNQAVLLYRKQGERPGEGKGQGVGTRSPGCIGRGACCGLLTTAEGPLCTGGQGPRKGAEKNEERKRSSSGVY